MKIEELKDKKILILGFGLEGKATLAFLKHFFPNKEIGIADQKDGPDYLDKQKDYDLVIRTPGIPHRFVTAPYTTATNIFFANTKGKIIGVTGSKGKSTTSMLLRDIIKKAGKRVELVGNIGIPMLDYLRGQDDSDCIYVAELSSYLLEDLRYSPHISVFLNFFPDHMDYHGGLESYWEAKKNIVKYASAEDYFVFNPAYESLTRLAKEIKAKAVPFIEKLPFSDIKIPLLGEHNKDNIRGAVTAVSLLGVSEDVEKKAIEEFKPLSHRLQNVGTFKGITFYDDAISTTPESTIAALRALPKVGIILLGGTDRGYDFSDLAAEVVGRSIGAVVLFPESGAKIKKALEKSAKAVKGDLPKIFNADDMKTAIKFSYENAKSGEICLLSCASPSYSLWKNFEEKGDLFTRYAKELS